MSHQYNKSINGWILQCNNVDSLVKLVGKEGHNFNGINAATACHKLAKLLTSSSGPYNHQDRHHINRVELLMQ